MIHGAFNAMGTGVEVWSSDEGGLDAVRDWFEEVERACSRFRPESALSVVNRCTESIVVVDGILRDVIEEAQRLRAISGGLVDAGVGSIVSAWGYDRSYEQVAAMVDDPPDQETPVWELHGSRLSRSPGTSLDLGGVAKGWACDRAVEAGLCVVVSAGGDVCSAHPETVVPVIDPWGDTAATARLGVGGLATSSTTRRRWAVGSREVCHLIDPRTLRPVESPILSSTVVAGTAVEAEAAAKAVLLLGESGLAWADTVDWVRGALVVWLDGSVYATTGMGWAA